MASAQSDNPSYESVLDEYTARTQRPENVMRQCIVEGKWNGEILECDKCGMRNPTIGLYVCDFCDITYCLICTPKTRFFFVGDTPLTFCSKSCTRGCLEDSYEECVVCIRCKKLKSEEDMQRIDEKIGNMCMECLSG
jgi:hypothetical protein